jgi:dihydrofolate reductase
MQWGRGKEFVFPKKGRGKMRKVIASEMITLDGFFAGPEGDLSWHLVDDDYRRLAVDLLSSADTLVFGRVTYELMAGFWPTEAAVSDDPAVAECKCDYLMAAKFDNYLA